MAKILLIAHMQSLRPVSDEGEDIIRKIGHGNLVMCDLKKKRNLRFFRLFWVLMDLVWKQSDSERWPTVEEYADAVKVMAGLRNSIFLPDGNVVYRPGSIAFHNMDELTFSAFYDRVCDVIARDFLPGVTKGQLYDEVSFIVGAAFMPARAA